MFSATQNEQLNKPLDKAVVRQRSQGGRNLSYVEGHYAIRKANDIFGFDGWTRSTIKMDCVVDDAFTKNGKQGYLVAYIAQVKVVCNGVETDGYGYGEGIDYNNRGQAHESAVKEAETDAMKRALIKFGDQFGLALYDKDQAHVEGSRAAAKPAAPAPEPKASPETERLVAEREAIQARHAKVGAVLKDLITACDKDVSRAKMTMKAITTKEASEELDDTDLAKIKEWIAKTVQASKVDVDISDIIPVSLEDEEKDPLLLDPDGVMDKGTGLFPNAEEVKK